MCRTELRGEDFDVPTDEGPTARGVDVAEAVVVTTGVIAGVAKKSTTVAIFRILLNFAGRLAKRVPNRERNDEKRINRRLEPNRAIVAGRAD